MPEFTRAFRSLTPSGPGCLLGIPDEGSYRHSLRGRMRRIHCLMCALLALAWAAPLTAQQPTGTIRGRITDNGTQQPISGATIAVAGRSALTQLTAEEFNPGRIISPEQLIQNKIPGVQVVDNNEPGGGLNIRVRGPTSVDALSEPLYVVDGVPLGIANGAGGGLSAGRNPLNFLNPNDIESIT